MSECELLVGLDIGTTGVKGVVLDPGRGVVAEAWCKQQLLSPQPGWAEMVADEWWDGAVDVLRQLLAEPDVEPGRVAAVGVSGMVPALVLLDARGKPLRNSIQQNDARTTKELDWWRASVTPDEFFAVTGGSVNQQLIGPKLRWLAEHEPTVWQATHQIAGSYDYVNYRLTGELGVEANWALESGLADVHKGTWHWPYVDMAGLRTEQLPTIRQPSELIGCITAAAAEATGLRQGTPVIGGAADHVASAFAAGLIDHGDLNLKFGGAGDILFCLDTLRSDPRLFIDYHLMPGKYLLNGCMATSGSVLKWFVQSWARVSDRTAQRQYQLLDELAAPLDPSPDSIVLLPYFLGEKTPLHDPLARGTMVGLRLHHRTEHIHRAILEAVVFGFRHHLEVMAELGYRPGRVVATDGGARSALWRQIAADVLQMPVTYQARHPGSALGAAFAAGIGAGIIRDWRAIRQYTEISDTTQPRATTAAAYDHLYGIYRDLYPALRPIFAALAATPDLRHGRD
jgi:xylulokinase